MTVAHDTASATVRPWANWPGNLRATPRHVVEPHSADELAAALAGTPPAPVRPVGASRSDSPLPSPPSGTAVSLRRLNRPLAVDADAREVTVESGMTIDALHALLARHGLAVTGVPATGDATVGGAIGAGSHGSGLGHGSLASRVRALTLVGVDGAVHHCGGADGVPLDAARVSLGALGIVTTVTLACEPAMTLWVTGRRTTFERAVAELDELAHDGDFTTLDWNPWTGDVTVRVITRERPEGHRPSGRLRSTAGRLGDRAYTRLVGPTVYRPVRSAVLHRTLGRCALLPVDASRPSHELLSPGGYVRRLAVEYALPRARAAAALTELGERIRRDRLNVHSPVAIRFGPAETGWLAPAHGRDTCWVNLLVHRPHGDNTRPVPQFAALEAVLRAYGARPNWAKNHGFTARSLAASYPRWADFLAVRRALDPDGRLLNPYLRSLFGVGDDHRN